MVSKSTASRLTRLVTTWMSVKTTLSPSSSVVFEAGLGPRRDSSTSTSISLSASSTVSAVSLRVTGFLPAIASLSFLGVTTSRAMPSRSMPAPRLVDRSAPRKRSPISPSAAATSVEVTQWVCCSPSTLSSSGRPKRTLIRLPSSTDSSTLGATMSCSPTSMPSDSRTSPTVSPMAVTSCSCPSRERVTVRLRAAYPTVVPARARTTAVARAIRTTRLLIRVDSLLCSLLGTILRTSYSPVLGCQRAPARRPSQVGEWCDARGFVRAATVRGHTMRWTESFPIPANITRP